MNDSPFKIIREARARENIQEAFNWFRRQVAKIKNITPEKLLRDKDKLTGRVFAQSKGLYMFKYDPKTKATLPYYDKFPLVMPLEIYKGGFLGVNFHYLPPKFRKVLLDAKSGRVTYKALKRNKYLKPTIKRYLNKHVTSKFLRVEEEDWETALYLPVERFVKAKNKTVWSNSI
tara:strand:- start:6416 stop:6937 length:522 start_codon:yes stop_codon:yes gene_type:complete